MFLKMFISLHSEISVTNVYTDELDLYLFKKILLRKRIIYECKGA
jgi:hypothetical protein